MINSFSGKYRFLSNFYPSEITIDGIVYPTVEHFFQAMKTEDIKQRQEIAQANSPGSAKRLGRGLLLRKYWEYMKDIYMLQGVIEKFTKYPDLAQKLINTHPHQLIEGNTWGDTYWGVYNSTGLNRLGQILMLIRSIVITTIRKNNAI